MFEPLTVVLLLALPFVVCGLAAVLIDGSCDPCVSHVNDRTPSPLSMEFARRVSSPEQIRTL